MKKFLYISLLLLFASNSIWFVCYQQQGEKLESCTQLLDHSTKVIQELVRESFIKKGWPPDRVIIPGDTISCNAHVLGVDTSGVRVPSIPQYHNKHRFLIIDSIVNDTQVVGDKVFTGSVGIIGDGDRIPPRELNLGKGLTPIIMIGKWPDTTKEDSTNEIFMAGKRDSALGFGIETMRQSPITERDIVVVVNSGWFIKKCDTCQWVFPPIKDTANMIIEILDSWLRTARWGSIRISRQDSLTNKYVHISNQWANTCRWICADYGIGYPEFLHVVQRHSYTPKNLYNKKHKKNKA